MKIKINKFAQAARAIAAAALCCAALITGAQAKTYTAGEIKTLADGILAFEESQSGASGTQEWLDGPLTEGAGASSEWYVIALRQSGGSYDFTAYADALENFLGSNKIASATARQKYALALIAAGRGSSDFVTSTPAETIGKQGIMSWAYGLHLINNGLITEEYSADEIVAEILSKQLDDGGWALTGKTSDADVTAMTLQALAPYYADKENVREAVDGALGFLSDKQLASGGYSSYGTENAESNAQVIIALSALGVDVQTDPRFTKNGSTPLDRMLEFRLGDGGYSHMPDGDYNRIATSQAYSALVACLRFADNRGPFYIIDTGGTAAPSETADASPNDGVTAPVTAGESTAVTGGASSAPDARAHKNYKPWAILAVAGAAAAVCAAFWLTGRRNPKNFIFIIAAATVISGIIALTDFKSADEYYSGVTEAKSDVAGSVTLTIRCDTIAGEGKNEYVPADGAILGTTEFAITSGETVYDVLVEAARTYNIQLENKGAALGGMPYISGINYIYEFDYGDLSGWIYRVNGERPPLNCGDYTLSDGDKIEWLYTKALGDDLK